MPVCTCYVRHLPREQRFCTRNGAHSLGCPWYRESADPVDRLKDEQTRRIHEDGGTAQITIWPEEIEVHALGIRQCAFHSNREFDNELLGQAVRSAVNAGFTTLEITQHSTPD